MVVVEFYECGDFFVLVMVVVMALWGIMKVVTLFVEVMVVVVFVGYDE